jgi:Raf kinase inhibitor-like YbhB/YbcL family protein
MTNGSSDRPQPAMPVVIAYERWHDARMNKALVLFSLLPCLLAPHLVAQGKEGSTMSLQLTSAAFTHGGEISSKYTCEGQDISPPLAWSGVPPNAKSLVLIVDDPDAPDPAAPKMTWVHWVLYNMPPGAGALTEAVQQLPAGTLAGLNDWKRTGYGGPCPPIGRHRYFHKLYALDTVLPDLGKPTKAMLEAQMKGHVIAQAELMATYQKRK